MAARRKKSSKRSATKPTERLEAPLICIVDECLGRYAVPEALRAAGVHVILHHELFPAGTDDEAWLRSLAGRLDAVVLTKDSRIRKRAIERQALAAARLRVFALSAGNLSWRASSGGVRPGVAKDQTSRQEGRPIHRARDGDWRG